MLRATIKGREYVKRYRDETLEIAGRFNGATRDVNEPEYDNVVATLTADGTVPDEVQRAEVTVRAGLVGVPSPAAVEEFFDFRLARKIGDDDNRLREYAALPGRIYSVSFSSDGSQFAVGSSLDRNGEVRVYKVDNPQPAAKLEGERGPVYAVAYRPDGREVASAGFDGMVRFNDPGSFVIPS